MSGEDLEWDAQGRPHACTEIPQWDGYVIAGIIIDQYWDGADLEYWPCKGECETCGSTCTDLFTYTADWGEFNNPVPGPNTKRYTLVDPTNINYLELYDTLGLGGELIITNVAEVAGDCAVACVLARNGTDATHVTEKPMYAVYRPVA